MQEALKHVQAYVADRVPKGVTFKPIPAKDMHVTLKEIGNIGKNHSIRGKFLRELEYVAGHNKRFKVHGAFVYGKLKIRKDGLVTLRLTRSPKLTHLAKEIQGALHKRQAHLPVLKARFDFPNNAHVTLGHIDFRKKSFAKLRNKLEQITAAFSPAKMNVSVPILEVKEFVLLWSNSPAIPRVYQKKAKFLLGR